MHTTLASLPPEIHAIILRLLSHSDQCTCLRLNKKWHDLALPLVFHTIHFHVSNLSERRRNSNGDGVTRYRRSKEFQLYLYHHQNVANVVKQLIIHRAWVKESDDGHRARLDSGDIGRWLSNVTTDRMYFWDKSLAEPSAEFWRQLFSSLPNLQFFQWLGLPPPYIVIPGNIRQLNTHLAQIVVPSDFLMSSQRPIEGLETLEFDETSLHMRATFATLLRRSIYPGAWLCPADQHLIRSNVTTLQKLVASTGDFVEVASSSTDLPFLFKDLISLDLLFSLAHAIESSVIKHLAKLEHLVLHHVDQELDKSLREWSPLLPNLVSLQLLYHPRGLFFASAVSFEGAGEFIAAHSSLRRLHLKISASWDAVSTLFPTISRLNILEVFGFIARSDMPLGGLDLLLQNVPASVISLSLALPLNIFLHPPEITIDDLLSHFPVLPQLRLLRLQPLGVFFKSIGDSHAYAVARCPNLDHLEYFIQYGWIWSINRHPQLSLDLWPEKIIQAMNPVKGFDDVKWLFRYGDSIY